MNSMCVMLSLTTEVTRLKRASSKNEGEMKKIPDGNRTEAGKVRLKRG